MQIKLLKNIANEEEKASQRDLIKNLRKEEGIH